MFYFVILEMKLSDNEAEMLSLWEFNAAEAYTYHSMKVESETLDERVKAIQEKYV